MNRYLIWYKSSDGYERFKAEKDKDSAWEFIKSDFVKKIVKIRYIRLYEVFLFYIMNLKSIFENRKASEEKIDIVDCNQYEASNKRMIKKILKDLNISENDSIIDVGCGKGNMLKVFSKFNFSKIFGIDYSYSLIKSAKERLHNLQIKDYRLILLECDALNFSYYNLFNYIFIFNPFEGEYMEDFLKIVSKNKKIKIIYNNPVCKELMYKYGFKIKKIYTDFMGFEYWVFEN